MEGVRWEGANDHRPRKAQRGWERWVVLAPVQARERGLNHGVDC